LLDLSLRSNKLPSKLIAAFLKRMCQALVRQHLRSEEKIKILTLIANLMKRHPRCVRLIQKKNKKGMDKKFGEDPYKSDEKDPLVARAL
jgi:hypothetical protein